MGLSFVDSANPCHANEALQENKENLVKSNF